MAKILLIEDDKFIREIYQITLKEASYQVEVAEDGEIGLQKASQGGYDLILLDIILPKKDGLALLKELKKTPPQRKNKKIVMLTVLDQKTFIKESLKSGANGYLMKTVLTPKEILAEVKALLKES